MRHMVIILVLLHLIVLNVQASSGFTGSIYAIFQDRGENAIYKLTEDGWIKSSAPYQGFLNQLVAVNSNEFLALMDSSLVYIKKNGEVVVLLEKVRTFSYNSRRKLLFAVTFDADRNHKLKMIDCSANLETIIENIPPLGISSHISSNANEVVVEGKDKMLYIANIDQMIFSPLIPGEDPRFSHNGKFLAFLTPGERKLTLLDLRNNVVKDLKAQDVGLLSWLGDDALLYSYKWESWYTIQSTSRIGVLDIATGKTTRLPKEHPVGLTWLNSK